MASQRFVIRYWKLRPALSRLKMGVASHCGHYERGQHGNHSTRQTVFSKCYVGNQESEARPTSQYLGDDCNKTRKESPALNLYQTRQSGGQAGKTAARDCQHNKVRSVQNYRKPDYLSPFLPSGLGFDESGKDVPPHDRQDSPLRRNERNSSSPMNPCHLA